MDLLQEKGASSWLTALPVEDFGSVLHKGAICDALRGENIMIQNQAVCLMFRKVSIMLEIILA